MNRLRGEVIRVLSEGEICLIEILVGDDIFSAVVLEQANDYPTGKQVFLLFKETEVAIAKGFQGKISLRNRFNSVVESVDKGIILTKVKLNLNGILIHSIITSPSVEELDLKVGEEVTCFVKTNELMLLKE